MKYLFTLLTLVFFHLPGTSQDPCDLLSYEVTETSICFTIQPNSENCIYFSAWDFVNNVTCNVASINGQAATTCIQRDPCIDYHFFLGGSPGCTSPFIGCGFAFVPAIYEEPQIDFGCSIFGMACLTINGLSVQAAAQAGWTIIDYSGCVDATSPNIIQYTIMGPAPCFSIYEGELRVYCGTGGGSGIPPGGEGGGFTGDIDTRSKSESNSFENMTIYPNPTADRLNVDLDASFTGSYEIIDLNGKLLTSGSLNPKAVSIDVSNLREGCFIFRAIPTNNQDRSVQRKFIKI